MDKSNFLQAAAIEFNPQRAENEKRIAALIARGFISANVGPSRRQRRGAQVISKRKARAARGFDPARLCPCGSGKSFRECHLAQALAGVSMEEGASLSPDAKRMARNRRKAARRERGAR